MFGTLLSLVVLATAASAQSAVYGQCGGIGWSGATTCVAGATCTVANAYYSQCLPGSSTGGGGTTAGGGATTTSKAGSTSTASAPASSSSATPAAGNPFIGFTAFPSNFYAAEVTAAAALISDATTKAKALSVAKIASFTWLDTASKVPVLGQLLGNASALQKSSGTKQLVEFIVYDLPDRDCAAAASNGEFSYATGGAALYEAYIDAIAAQVAQFPDVRTVAIIEPDSLANLVTNLNVQKCANAQTNYLSSVNYALKTLSAAGIYMYMDAGHAGWLGWPANLSPAAQLFAKVWSDAGKSPFIRGLATDVSNYNALTTTSPDPVTQGDNNYDEQLYINALGPLLRESGWDAQFIVDQGRSGVQNIRTAWGDWCNVKGAGFGMRPSSDVTSISQYLDAVVWAKPGGESDGTSNTSSTRYDFHCGQSDAFQPSPEAGTWNQAYFVALVENANPPL